MFKIFGIMLFGTKIRDKEEDMSKKFGQSSRVAKDNVPIIDTPNLAESTPIAEFEEKVSRAVNGNRGCGRTGS